MPKKRTPMQDETMRAAESTTEAPGPSEVSGTGPPVSLAVEPSPPQILRASSQPLFPAPEAEATSPPLPPPPSPPPGHCDEPLDSDITDEQKQMDILNTLAQYLAACPSYLEMPLKTGHDSGDGGDTPEISCVPLADNKAWGFESIMSI